MRSVGRVVEVMRVYVVLDMRWLHEQLLLLVLNFANFARILRKATIPYSVCSTIINIAVFVATY